MRTRGIKISVRLNQGEHDHLMKQTEKSGLPAEALIRFLIMGVDVRPIPPVQLGEVIRQLSAIGNNVNQIARVANSTGRISREDIVAIQSMQAQIWHQVKGL